MDRIKGRKKMKDGGQNNKRAKGRTDADTERKSGMAEKTGNGNHKGTGGKRKRRIAREAGKFGSGAAAGDTEVLSEDGRNEKFAADYERTAAEETGTTETNETGNTHEQKTAQRTGEEIAQEKTEIIGNTYGTRKDWLDNCTEYGIASYLKKNLDMEYFRNCTVDDLEKWFLKEVDYNGREIEGYEL